MPVGCGRDHPAHVQHDVRALHGPFHIGLRREVAPDHIHARQRPAVRKLPAVPFSGTRKNRYLETVRPRGKLAQRGHPHRAGGTRKQNPLLHEICNSSFYSAKVTIKNRIPKKPAAQLRGKAGRFPVTRSNPYRRFSVKNPLNAPQGAILTAAMGRGSGIFSNFAVQFFSSQAFQGIPTRPWPSFAPHPALTPKTENQPTTTKKS